jgi:hypothetical protein
MTEAYGWLKGLCPLLHCSLQVVQASALTTMLHCLLLHHPASKCRMCSVGTTTLYPSSHHFLFKQPAAWHVLHNTSQQKPLFAFS